MFCFCVLRSRTSATGFEEERLPQCHGRGRVRVCGNGADGYADGYIRHSHEEGAGTNEANPNVSILAIRWMLYRAGRQVEEDVQLRRF